MLRQPTHFALFVVAAAGLLCCSKKPQPTFEMEITKVNEMRGFVMKGTSVSGIVSSGCIANNDPLVVTRDGETIVETTAKITNIAGNGSMGAWKGQTEKGDQPDFYLQDVYDTVKTGDIVSSTTSTCDPKKMRSKPR